MSTPAAPQPQATPATSLLKTLGLVSTVCGLIIVGAYQGTYDAAAACSTAPASAPPIR